MKIDFILQSDFPKDSDMVESFECQQTQTNRCVKKAKKKIVFNHMQVSMQRIKNVCLKLADSEVHLSSYETKIWFTLLCPHLALICLS